MSEHMNTQEDYIKKRYKELKVERDNLKTELRLAEARLVEIFTAARVSGWVNDEETK